MKPADLLEALRRPAYEPPPRPADARGLLLTSAELQAALGEGRLFLADLRASTAPRVDGRWLLEDVMTWLRANPNFRAEAKRRRAQAVKAHRLQTSAKHAQT